MGSPEQRLESLIGDIDGAVDRLSLLTFDILLNHFIGNGSTGGGKVATRPEVPAPERFLELREQLEELVRTLSFEFLDCVGDVNGNRVGDKQMHMVRRQSAEGDHGQPPPPVRLRLVSATSVPRPGGPSYLSSYGRRCGTVES